MWPSLETAVWVYDWANIALIVSLVVGVVATALIVWMGNVKGEYLDREVATANERAAEANRIAEAERLERIKLEAQVSPRRLTSEQQKRVASALRRFSGKAVSVTSYALDLEAALLGEQIIAALNMAGIRPDDRRLSNMTLGGFALAIHVSGDDLELSGAIRKALTEMGLDVSPDNKKVPLGSGISRGGGNPDVVADIFIGSKPIETIR